MNLRMTDAGASEVGVISRSPDPWGEGQRTGAVPSPSQSSDSRWRRKRSGASTKDLVSW